MDEEPKIEPPLPAVQLEIKQTLCKLLDLMALEAEQDGYLDSVQQRRQRKLGRQLVEHLVNAVEASDYEQSHTNGHGGRNGKL